MVRSRPGGSAGGSAAAVLRLRGPLAACLLLGLLAGAPDARADTVSIAAAKDNTLYSENGSTSNGAGQHFFVGRTNFNGFTRRAVIAFDIARSIPSGSTITSAQLTLNMSRTMLPAVLHPVGLHPLLADWGEGSSDATLNEGGGAPATTGDATWTHRFFSSTLWGRPGGDFEAVPSAVNDVVDVGLYTWGSTPDMVADVQGWLDDPAKNFGWILLGNETSFGTAKRFDSRQNLAVLLRPGLKVEFTSTGILSGQVPDGSKVPGVPLSVRMASGGSLTLSWGASCLSTDTDYEVYEGVLRNFTSHVPRVCSTAGATTATLPTPQGNVYYLVVPRNAGREGSYGIRSTGAARAPSLSACLPQATVMCQ